MEQSWYIDLGLYSFIEMVWQDAEHTDIMITGHVLFGLGSWLFLRTKLWSLVPALRLKALLTSLIRYDTIRYDRRV